MKSRRDILSETKDGRKKVKEQERRENNIDYYFCQLSNLYFWRDNLFECPKNAKGCSFVSVCLEHLKVLITQVSEEEIRWIINISRS